MPQGLTICLTKSSSVNLTTSETRSRSQTQTEYDRGLQLIEQNCMSLVFFQRVGSERSFGLFNCTSSSKICFARRLEGLYPALLSVQLLCSAFLVYVIISFLDRATIEWQWNNTVWNVHNFFYFLLISWLDKIVMYHHPLSYELPNLWACNFSTNYCDPNSGYNCNARPVWNWK